MQTPTALSCAWVEIDRAAPDSIDAMYSLRGHEPRIRSPKLTSEEEITAYIAANAPEVLTVAPDVYQDNRPSSLHTIAAARDHRNYSTALFIHRHYQ